MFVISITDIITNRLSSKWLWGQWTTSLSQWVKILEFLCRIINSCKANGTFIFRSLLFRLFKVQNVKPSVFLSVKPCNVNLFPFLWYFYDIYRIITITSDGGIVSRNSASSWRLFCMRHNCATRALLEILASPIVCWSLWEPISTLWRILPCIWLVGWMIPILPSIIKCDWRCIK